MKLRRSVNLATGMASVLLATLTLGAVSAQASTWLIDGIEFHGEAAFVSSGSFELEPTGITPHPIIQCSESGSGKIYEDWKFEWKTTLTGCKFTEGNGLCEFKPVEWTVKSWQGIKTWFHNPVERAEHHTAGYPTKNVLGYLQGNQHCGWYSETMPIPDPDLELNWYGIEEPYRCAGDGLHYTYGTEAQSLPVTTYACPATASSYLFIRGSSTLQLAGPNIGHKFTFGRPPAPQVTALDPTEVTGTSATLNGLIKPQGGLTNYSFYYGAITNKVTSTASVSAGLEPVKVSSEVSNLEPNTNYHYVILAENAGGTSWSEYKVFNTGTHEWGLQPTEEPKGSTGAMLESVSCAALETCAAVGFYWPSSGARAMTKIETNGFWWSPPAVPNPSGALSNPLFDVSCTASNACTAVGYVTNSTGGSPTPAAAGWNGSSWSIQSPPLPSGASYGYLYGVSCPASDDCIAVGRQGSGKTLAERWDGSNWSAMTSPSIEGATEFRGVSCVSSNDCWAVGKVIAASEGALAMHWDGTAWSVSSPSLSKPLLDVSCVSSSSCVATTDSLTFARWNGSSWSTETAITPAGAKGTPMLSDVSCASANACVATGSYRTSKGVLRELAEGWDGSKWSIQSTSAPAAVEAEKEHPVAELTGGVSCTSATACTAVGHSQASESAEVRSMVEVRH